MGVAAGRHLGEVPGQLLGRLGERVPLLHQLSLREINLTHKKINNKKVSVTKQGYAEAS
jgi:hypothetical protein